MIIGIKNTPEYIQWTTNKIYDNINKFVSCISEQQLLKSSTPPHEAILASLKPNMVKIDSISYSLL